MNVGKSTVVGNGTGVRFNPVEYERRAFPKRGGVIVSERELADVLELSKGSPGPYVLEIGIGTGRVLKRLAAENLVVVGVDADRRMIQHLAKRTHVVGEPTGERIDLVVAEGQRLPFRENTFGSVVCVRVLRYLHQPQRAVVEMCNLLVPGGRLVLEFANILRLQALAQLPQYISKQSLYPRLFRRRDLEHWVTSQRMQIKDLRGWHKVPPEILSLSDNRVFLGLLSYLEVVLQRILPPEFLSRSLVICAVKK